ncbi:LPS export ABC transporter permease LptF [Pseudotabrizicola sp. L79]|uniref:LPS export ABC transporter permease LptF n=1 Tax=Pseudotabrizicola sp. L79 TaxID=3118402 RepID=UPI002F93BBF5
MSRFDRYLLSQFLALFGFFSLLLVSVYWVNRAVGLFDQLIGDGQSALVFVEFSLLTLPNVIRLVLPISAFAAALFVTNRLTNESELVVMQATGFSAFRLARPVIYFGLVVGLMLAVLTHVLVPASRAILAERSVEISQNVTARFLRDGQFIHPTDGVTLYIRELTQTGELRDLFLSDERGQGSVITYTARRAFLARSDDGPKLLLFDGMTQTLDQKTGRLSVTRFADVTYDLADMLSPQEADGRSIYEVSTPELLRASPELAAEVRQSRAALLEEGHSRIAQPLLGLVTALIGFSTLLLGAFSRFGLWRQIIGAIVLLVILQMLITQASALALESAAAWPLIYLAPGVGILASVLILWLAQRPRRIRSGTIDLGGVPQ